VFGLASCEQCETAVLAPTLRGISPPIIPAGR
jgi:hypothetical protein